MLESTEENFQPGEFQSLQDKLKQLEKNIELDSKNPIVQGGFTQVPNFVLEKTDLSVGAKVIYAMFLSYAWHNDRCFPGQERLAKDVGLTRQRVSQFVRELENTELITTQRRGQGKTNLYKIHFVVQKPKKKKGL